MTRLLAHTRLSDLTDETTSPERQKKEIEGYARRDDTIVAWTEDLDVSGSISPFDRKDLGSWLTDPEKISLWDAIIVAKLDRLTRNLFDFLEFWRWCNAHGKAIISVQERFDFTSPQGRAFVQMLAVFAEFERGMISERVRQSATALRAAGQYAGGSVPFGLMPVRLNGKGWGFIPDPEFAPVVAEMASRFLDGQSLNQITTWLNDEHIPTSRDVVRRRQGKPEVGTEWRATTVRKVLSSPTLTGVMTADGAVLRDADGVPIQRCGSIISRETYELIKKRLNENSDRTGPRVNSSALLRVAYCGGCGSVMYQNKTTTAGKVYTYYECKGRREGNGCTEKKIHAELIENMLEQTLLDAVGNDKTRTKKVIPATDNTAEIAQIEEAIDNLTATYASAGMSAERYAKTVAKLEAIQAALGTPETRPEEVQWVEGSDTVSQRWNAIQDRNAYLRAANIKIYVQHHDMGGPNSFEHGLTDLPEVQVKVEPPDDENITNCLVYKDGIMAKLFLGDLSRTALRETPYCSRGSAGLLAAQGRPGTGPTHGP